MAGAIDMRDANRLKPRAHFGDFGLVRVPL
jgi:hypothetical protein